MGRLETVSTASVPANKKIRFWNEAVSSAVAPAAADPLDQETFQGQLKLLDLGSLRLFSDGHESIARPGQAGSGLATRLS